MSRQMSRIIAEMESYTHLFDFDRDGLGEQVAETSAAGIFEYMEAQTAPDNNPWIELAESYRRWKERHYPGRRIGELHYLMKDPMQLKGELQIASDEMTQTYGLDETARLEAEWFQEGHQGQNQPPRPFYDFNDLMLIYLTDLFDSIFATIR